MVQDLHRSAHPDKYREISPEQAESFLSERLSNQRCFVRNLVDDVRARARTHGIEQVVLNVWEFEGNGRRFFLDCGFQDFGYQ